MALKGEVQHFCCREKGRSLKHTQAQNRLRHEKKAGHCQTNQRESREYLPIHDQEKKCLVVLSFLILYPQSEN